MQCDTLAFALLALAPAVVAQTQLRTPSANAEQVFLRRLVAAAEERTHHTVRYDPAYVRIPYPGGDVPAEMGVCTDEIIRPYRAVGVDLQKEVHEDMEKHWSVYPQRRRWLLSRPDTNIDHRRVPNLMVFFSRKGESLAMTDRPEDYSPGDLVTWDLSGGVPHMGIVVDENPQKAIVTLSCIISARAPSVKTSCSRGSLQVITAIMGRASSFSNCCYQMSRQKVKKILTARKASMEGL